MISNFNRRKDFSPQGTRVRSNSCRNWQTFMGMARSGILNELEV